MRENEGDIEEIRFFSELKWKKLGVSFCGGIEGSNSSVKVDIIIQSLVVSCRAIISVFIHISE